MNLKAPTIAIALLLGISTANAASFTCGYEMCAKHGISRAECAKRGLSLALSWAKAFPRTAAVPGAVVVQSRAGMDASGKRRGGHVSKIVEVKGHCRAVVIDNRHRPYVRNICSRLVAYVSPSRAWTE